MNSIDSAILYILSGKFVVGLLIFIRITGLMASAPFFKNSAIPMQVKAILTLILAVSVTGTYWNTQPVIEFHLWYMVIIGIKEFMVGAILGFSAQLVFFAARTAGGLIDMDMGYQTAAMFDQNQTSPTLIGEFYELVVLMIFLVLNGHHHLIEAIYGSLLAVPLTTFEITGSTVQLLLTMATSVLIIAIKMAAPLIVSLFLTNLSLTLLARVAPQTNIFVLSFQLKVGIGLLMLIATAPVMVMVAKYGLSQLQEQTFQILLSLNPGRV